MVGITMYRYAHSLLEVLPLAPRMQHIRPIPLLGETPGMIPLRTPRRVH